MTVTIAEKYRGTSGSSESWRVQYVVEATGADADKTEFELAEAVALQAPDTITDNDGGGLILGDVAIDEFYPGTDVTHAIATVSYNLPQLGSKLGKANTTPLSELVTEFNYQAQSQHITFALDTRGREGDDGHTFNTDFLNHRINVRKDGNDLITDGLDTPAGGATKTYRFTVPRGYVSDAYELLVDSMMGGVNQTTFKGRAPGTMRLVNVQSSVSSASLNIAFGLHYSPNRTDVKIGGIPHNDIGGHEHEWSYDEKSIDTVNKLVIIKTRAIIVQQIFPYVEMNDLGI